MTVDAERRSATNAFAFSLWLPAAFGVTVADWDALHAFSLTPTFTTALSAFARHTTGEPRDVAATLLHRDLRPDDVLLTADGLPWAGAGGAGTWLRDEGDAEGVLARAAARGVTVLAMPVGTLARAGPHDAEKELRQIVSIGGPCPIAPPGIVLLGSDGDIIWGDPLAAPDTAALPRPALCVRPPSPSGRDAP